MNVRLPRLPFPPSPLTVWSTEPERAQLTWGARPAGPLRVSVPGLAPVHTQIEAGPGALELPGLRAGTATTVSVGDDRGSTELDLVTPPLPGGSELVRFATISDLHLGSDHFGVLKQMRDNHHSPEPFAFRSASAAIREAVAWGAEQIVIKGDAAHHGRHEDFAEVGRLVDSFADVPMILLPGNHDVDCREGVRLPETVGARRLPYERGARAVDLPGLRLVVADTTIEEKGTGTLADVGDAILDLAADADRPTLLAIHQQLQHHDQPRYWPPGISGREGRPFLDRLGTATSRCLVTSGHTHRNRIRRHGTTVVTEVASTHHWPGVWAGYVVYEGGITQTVRRIGSPEIIGWHEYTKNAVASVWHHYAKGSPADRSLSHPWP